MRKRPGWLELSYCWVVRLDDRSGRGEASGFTGEAASSLGRDLALNSVGEEIGAVV